MGRTTKTSKELETKATKMKQLLKSDVVYYVPANGHWFSKRNAADFVASLWDGKVIKL